MSKISSEYIENVSWITFFIFYPQDIEIHSVLKMYSIYLHLFIGKRVDNNKRPFELSWVLARF